MNRIKLKLTEREMYILIQFLDEIHEEKSRDAVMKLIHNGIADLLYKLLTAQVMVKKKYDVQISVSSGLALLTYWKYMDLMMPSLQATLLYLNKEKLNTITQIIGIIDQKLK